MEFGKFHYTVPLDLARELVRELVCDLLWLSFITLSRSQTWLQTWFPISHGQVRATPSQPVQVILERYLAR